MPVKLDNIFSGYIKFPWRDWTDNLYREGKITRDEALGANGYGIIASMANLYLIEKKLGIKFEENKND